MVVSAAGRAASTNSRQPLVFPLTPALIDALDEGFAREFVGDQACGFHVAHEAVELAGRRMNGPDPSQLRLQPGCQATGVALPRAFDTSRSMGAAPHPRSR